MFGHSPWSDLHFDLQGPDWRQVPLEFLREDFDKNKDTYGAVVLIAEAQSTRGSRYNESAPVSGIVYHRLVISDLYTNTYEYKDNFDPQWMNDIQLVLKREMGIFIYCGPDYEGYFESWHNNMDVPLGYRDVSYDRSGEPWWIIICLNPWSPHERLHDCKYSGEPAEGFNPLTPVYRLQGNIWVKTIVPQCRLLAEPFFWWLTTLCNLVISGCLSSIAWFYTSTPLVTIGDVMDSFLTQPPPRDSRFIPRSSCTYSSPSFTNMFRPSLPAQEYKAKARRWWKAVSMSRWSFTMLWFAYLFTQCVVLYSLTQGDKMTRRTSDAQTEIQVPVSSAPQGVEQFQVTGSDTSPTRWRLVLLANTPQVFLSVTYLFFNNILTTMVVEQEWHSFLNASAATDKWKSDDEEAKRTLRTSQPRGLQRETFFLGLPYRYALPFVVTSTVMHWLVSRSLFFSQVDFYDIDRKRNENNPPTSTLRYSDRAAVWVIMLGTISWGTILGLAMFRKGGRMGGDGAGGGHDDDGNRDGNDEEGDADIAAGPLSWGAIRQVVVRDGVEVEERWLGFTKGEAEMPVAGEVYG
ncbi:hypothetical protein B0T20DRAFT_451271 [Sordaria brevicollis]|uniref:Uncharacterized protein n=1 Tax=Sordaria brevicollis TaxID=83679 RepID=A0AAE0UEH7_SORBR|nr:hypothetical protein B0T20DRAFT_451271 [Sordaria brevicollis]